MTARRRLDRLERSLAPQAAVLLWVETAKRHGSLNAFARSLLDGVDPGADLRRIHDQVVSWVADTTAGKSTSEIAKATAAALRQAMSRYQLVLVLNRTAAAFAQVVLLQSWVLVDRLERPVLDPSGDGAQADGDRSGAGRQVDRAEPDWCALSDALVRDVRVEQRARSALDDAYFGGRSVLFPDVAEDWAALRGQADRLSAIVGSIRARSPATTKPGSRNPLGPSMNARVDARGAELADDARIATFEFYGERDEVLAIATKRLRAEESASSP